MNARSDNSRNNSPRPPAPRKVGRPPGKKSNPAYAQVTVYLRRELHRTAKRILLDQRREFSALVEQLVGDWLETQGYPDAAALRKPVGAARLGRRAQAAARVLG